MPLEYYHDIDLNARQLLNSRLHNISTGARIILGGTLGMGDAGYQVYDVDLSSPFFWDGVQWNAAGGGGGGTWGSITGIVTDQTDLIDYLDLNYYPLSTNPANYLTSFTEVDPVFNTWLTTTPPLYSFTETDPIWTADKPSYLTSAAAALAYETIITAGTSGQYWRGDKTWQNFPSIPTVSPSALTKTDDTNVTLTLGGSPSTALLQATSLTLGWTGTLADGRIASATTWNAKEPAISTGTTGQYWRGDKTWQTFPSIPTVGTWGALNYPSWTTGTPFVKMTAAGTFSLDTNTYLTSFTETDPVWTADKPSYLTSATAATTYVPYTGATTDVNLGTKDIYASNFIIQPTGFGILAALTRNLTGSGYGALNLKNGATGYIQPTTLSVDRTYTLPNATGTFALTSDIPSLTPAALTKTDDTNVTLTLGGTPATSLLQATSLTLGWTGTLADSRITSASTWNAKEPGITVGTTAQYWRGDKTWQTLPIVPTKTSELTNDGDNGYTHFISLEDLPSNLTLYATNVASGINSYTKAVSSLTDPDYNTVAVNIPVGPLTSTTVATYCGGIVSSANIINGNPGIFTMSTIGSIRRTTGTAEGVFYYEVYKRDSGGTETLIVTSANTYPVSSPIYVEFNAAALFNNGVFTATDRIVIKFYGLRLTGGSDPSFQFQFGGIAPVRTTLPIPLAVTPVPREILSISTATAAGSIYGIDYIYLVSGTTTLTLPTAVGSVSKYTIKRVGTGVVSIATTSSQTIDGSASPITINVQNVSLDLISDGTNWNII